jgi:hypothetical protein
VRRRSNISDRELQRRAFKRAMSIPHFCELYDIGRTTANQEIKEGRLRARKVRRRTLIGSDDAEAWWLASPTLNEAASLTAVSGPQAASDASVRFEDTALVQSGEGEPDTPKTHQPSRRRAKTIERVRCARMSKSGS